MLTKKQIRIILTVFYIILFAAVSWFYNAGKFEGLEVKIIDMNFKRRGPVTADKKVVIIGFTDACILEIGKWPWKRDVHAETLKKLQAVSPSAIAVDVQFQDRSLLPDEDKKLIETIGTGKNIVLPLVISPKAEYADGGMIYSKQVAMPFNELKNVCKNFGYINVNYETLNTDGILRNMPLIERIDKNSTFESFAYKTALVSGLTNFKAGENGYFINYHGPDKTYEHVSFSSVYSQKVDLSYFKDKIILIGPAATAFEDLHHTPYGTIGGTEVQANIVDCIINNSFLNRTSKIFNISFLLILTIISIALFFYLKVPAVTLINFTLLVTLLFFNYVVFAKLNLIFDIIPAVFLIIAGHFICGLFMVYANLLVSNGLLQKRVRELDALYSISKNISELINLDKILKDVLNEAINTMGAERGSIMLIDEDEQKLEVKVVAGIENPFENKILIPTGEGIAGEVFLNIRSMVSNDGDKDPRFKNYLDKVESGETSTSRSRVRNILCAPLLIGEKKPIGVINIVNRRDNAKFLNEDVKLIETIAHHAATLIENSKLYKLATVDGMTGLYVHRYFQIRLKEEFSRAVRYEKNIAIIMTDIDHFKKFNDTYGHQCGDMVLTHVAKIVRDTIRNIDIAARYGGEEFAVILPETDGEGAMKLAERIRKNVEESFCHTPKGNLKVTISLGVSSNPVCDAPNQAALIACADNALYKSKENGRNKVTFFEGKSPQNNSKAEEY